MYASRARCALSRVPSSRIVRASASLQAEGDFSAPASTSRRGSGGQSEPLLDVPFVTVVSPEHPLAKVRGVISKAALEEQVQLVLTVTVAGLNPKMAFFMPMRLVYRQETH